MLTDDIYGFAANKTGPIRRFLWPHPALRPYIAHYTLFFPRPRSGHNTFTVIPDASGCLVFTFAHNVVHGAFLGAATKAQAVSNDAFPRLFVEFLPGGARRLLNLPHNELTDLKLPLADLLPQLNNAMLERIERANNLLELHAFLDGLYLRLLSQRPGDHPLFPALQRLRLIREPLPTVGVLAQESCYSERHLSRVANEQLGLGLKTYLRVLRINRVLHNLRTPGYAGSALSLGYFDQAHFIHDFKDICGITPAAFMQNKSDFYNEPFKF